MSRALQTLRDQLHISHSQLFTYLNCSLKYFFAYVQKVPGKHSSINLHFGKAIHAAIELLYRSLQETGSKPSFAEVESVFMKKLYQSMEAVEAPILFKKNMPDIASSIFMGKKMLEVFHEQTSLARCTIEAVELPLSASLYNADGKSMDIQLVGIIDLLLRDEKGKFVVVDHKTSSQAKSQAAIDDDLQATAYSYLLAANSYVFPRADVQARFDVLRKLKTPKLEQYHTTRGPDSRKRFAKLSAAVLAGIDNRVFLPCRGWLCADCEHIEHCQNW
jgi:putative RecB family exonuclease